MGAALAAGALLSFTACLAVDLLGDVRGGIKDIRGDLKGIRGDIRRDLKDLRGDIKDLGTKMDTKFDALIQEEVLTRLTRLEDARLLRK
jgi:hypothetical protein